MRESPAREGTLGEGKKALGAAPRHGGVGNGGREFLIEKKINRSGEKKKIQIKDERKEPKRGTERRAKNTRPALV